MKNALLLIIALVSLISVSLLIKNSHLVYALTNTVTLNPNADSYVDSSNPSANYGSSTQFRVDGSPTVVSYLKFQTISFNSTVSKAVLKIYANSAQSSGFQVRAVADNNWQENTINFTNKPAYSNIVTGSSGAITAGKWYQVDVTSLVPASNTVTFALTTTNVTALSLASRESANRPQLVVDFSIGSLPTPTPTPIPTNIILPTPTPVVLPTSTPSATQTPLPSLTPMPTLVVTPTPTVLPTPPNTPNGGDIDPIISAAGDISCGAGSGGASCKQMDTSNLLINMNPAAVLLLGDNQYEGGALSDYNSFYDASWGRLKSITYPSVGNHEYLTANASGYYDYFNGVGNQTGRAGDRSQGYYSYDLGSWHLIALNTNCSNAGGCSPGSPQETWLRQDLAAHPNQCTLAYYHIPLYSSGGRANANSKSLYQALYDYNADLVLAGHDHTYERFSPQDANGKLDLVRGIRSFIVGTGGRNHTHLANKFANSEKFDDTSFGVLKVTLHAASYDWEFVPIFGNAFTDSGTQLCH